MQNVIMLPDEFDEKKTELLKTTICKGATNDELQLFIHACKRTGLDPFMKQIHAVKRRTKNGEVMTIQVSIDGFRLLAERSGKYSPGKEPTFKYDQNDKLLSATAYVKKQTADGTWHEVAASALYDEYVQKYTYNGKETIGSFWKDKPHIMLAKVAEALALRKAFPADLSGLYTKDEMMQADNGKPPSTVLDTETEIKYEEAQTEKLTGLSQDKIEQIEAALDDAGAIEADLTEMFNWKQIGDISQLTERDFQDCMNFIKHIKAKRNK